MPDLPIYINSVDNFMTTSPQITKTTINDIEITGRPYILKIKYMDTMKGKDEIKEKEIIVIASSPGEAIQTLAHITIDSVPKWERVEIKVTLPDIILDRTRQISF